MAIDIKKLLLTGTALVAVSGFAVAANAAELDLTASDTWADGGVGPLGAAADGDDIDISVNAGNITVTNDGVADDGNGIDDFVIGDITDSSVAEDGDLIIVQSAGGNALGVDINNATLDGNVTIDSDDASDAAVTVTVAEDLTVGGALTITNGETDNGANVDVTITDDLVVTGVTTLVAGDQGGADVTLTVTDNATFTGSLDMDDFAGATGDTFLILNGTTTQTIAGAIDGGGANEGFITVANAAGVTFTGAIGTTFDIAQITLSNNTAGATATFQADVGVDNASGIVLGDGGGTADTYTAIFDGTLTVSGTVQGAAVDTSNVVVEGGGVVTTDAAWGGVTALDLVSVTDSSILAVAASITANGGAGFSIGNGSTLRTTAAATLTGNINGAGGLLDVNAATNVIGNIGNTADIESITVANGIALTFTPGAATGVDVTDGITLEDDGVDNGGGGALVLTNGAQTLTISSNIYTALDAEGGITVTDAAGAGTVAFTGDIGTAAANLATFAVGHSGANNDAVTTTGNLYIDQISLGDVDTLTFLGDGVSQTVSGTIIGNGGAGRGAVIVGDATVESDVTFQGIIGGTTIATFDVLENARATLNANATTATDFTVDGTMRIGQAAAAASATVAAGTATDGVLEMVVGTTTAGVSNAGRLNLTNMDFANFDGGAAILSFQPIVGDGFIADGEEFLIAQESGGDSDIANADNTTNVTLTDNIALFNFRVVTGEAAEITTETVAAEELFMVADRVAASAVTETDNNANAIDGLLSIGDTDDTDVIAAMSNIQNASLDEIDELAESIAPTVDAGAMVAAVNVTNQSLGLINERLADARNGNQATSGIATGTMGSGNRFWGQAFGQTADQSHRDDVDGYESDTIGFAVGADSENVADNMVVGLAFSYGNTDVDSKNANDTETDVDSYQVTLYGTYDMDDVTFLNGSLGYAWNDVDTTRHNVGGVAGLTANGDYDADQFVAEVEMGRDYMVEGNTKLTPSVLAHWTHYSPDSYTETGAGGMNLSSDGDSVNVFQLGANVAASWEMKGSNGSTTVPGVHAGYRYDLAGDDVQTTSTFTGGGAAFETDGMDPARSTFNVGLDLAHHTTSNWEFRAAYDFEFKSDYDAHSGILRAGYKF